MTNPQSSGPLAGLKVLELATIVAGPLAGGLLADFGADVIKVEMPGQGDGLRQLRPHKDGISLWSKVLNRNKRAITVDLRKPEGVEIIKQLVADADVLIENFRPGTIERWGLGPEDLWAVNPRLTILRVSAFGQNGPHASKPGFARIADAMSGFLSLIGPPDGAPYHPGYPIADSVTGLFGALGIMMALFDKARNPDRPGQVVAVSLYESMFRILDFLAIEYDQLGEVRTRSGNRNPYAAPGNVYRTRDGKWCSLAASTQNLFERLMSAIGQACLIDDPRFADNRSRLANVDALDQLIGDWFARHDLHEACSHMDANSVSCAPVQTIEDVFRDQHALQTGMLVTVEDPVLGPVRMQGVTPQFSETPGRVRTPGPEVGAHNHDVFTNDLGLTEQDLQRLKVQKPSDVTTTAK